MHRNSLEYLHFCLFSIYIYLSRLSFYYLVGGDENLRRVFLVLKLSVFFSAQKTDRHHNNAMLYWEKAIHIKW